MKINLKEYFIMWENITIFIGQAWKLVFAVLHWTSTHISVGWLSFGVALLAFTRNNHKKLLQQFEYSSPTHDFKTTITVYNDSLGTESSRFMGILVTTKKNYCYRKMLLPWLIKHTKYADKIFPYDQMIDIQDDKERQKLNFFSIKSHEVRPIVIDRKEFLNHIDQRLSDNRRALKNFVNRKPVYMYFMHQTIAGKIKVFGLKIDYQDPIGKDLDMEKLKNNLNSNSINKTK